MFEDNKNLYLFAVPETSYVSIHIIGYKITKSEKQKENYDFIKNQFSLFSNYQNKEITNYVIKIVSKENILK